MKELWKPITNYEGLYEISNYGKVKSLHKKWQPKERILKPGETVGGYLQVLLYKNNISKRYYVHRLVLEAFVGPCLEGMETCHKDGVVNNNFIENLKYGTKKENQKDRILHGTNYYNLTNENTKGSNNFKAKLNEKQVRIIKWLLKDNYLTQREIGEVFSVSQSTINLIKNKKLWKHV